LQALTAAVVTGSAPTVLAGDFNATPWSSAFSGLAEQGLHRATGLTASWPAQMKGIFGIPIDHVMVTSHWAMATSQTGLDLGSDHLPVLVGLSLID
jgi:endonuclease/exonuclease/phosphatase (EEP) superfamily protein YafD